MKVIAISGRSAGISVLVLGLAVLSIAAKEPFVLKKEPPPSKPQVYSLKNATRVTGVRGYRLTLEPEFTRALGKKIRPSFDRTSLRIEADPAPPVLFLPGDTEARFHVEDLFICFVRVPGIASAPSTDLRKAFSSGDLDAARAIASAASVSDSGWRRVPGWIGAIGTGESEAARNFLMDDGDSPGSAWSPLQKINRLAMADSFGEPLDAAEAYMEVLSSADYLPIEAYLLGARSLVVAWEHERALEFLRRESSRFGLSPEWTLLAATVALAVENRAAAAEALDRAATIASENPMYHYLHAIHLAREGFREEALKATESAGRLTSDSDMTQRILSLRAMIQESERIGKTEDP